MVSGAFFAGAAQGLAKGTSDLNTKRDRAKERSIRERNATRADLTAKINGALATMKIAELPDEVKLDAYNNIYSPAMAELTGSPVAKASNWGVPLLKSVEEITKLLNSKGSPKDIRAGIGEFGRKNKGNQQFVDTYFGDNVKRLDETIAANDKAEFNADVDFFNQQAGVETEGGNFASSVEGPPTRVDQTRFDRISRKEGGAYGQRVANTAQVKRSEREGKEQDRLVKQGPQPSEPKFNQDFNEVVGILSNKEQIAQLAQERGMSVDQFTTLLLNKLISNHPELREEINLRLKTIFPRTKKTGASDDTRIAEIIAGTSLSGNAP